MSTIKISQLPSITGANAAGTDVIPIVDTSLNTTNKITRQEFFTNVPSTTISGNLTFGDNNKAIFGAGSDLQIYHDGADSYIVDQATGGLTILTNGPEVVIGKTPFESMARFATDGAVSLYYDNSKKLATTSTGVDVTGTVTADGLTVDGNITSTGGDLNLATLDLNAIAASKAVTAVDVFVYDTSKDSDGGAWRKRTQHTSWYNETLNTATRGSRREFPAVAVIVAEATKVTIYDGDDPALPMWMVFNPTGSGSVMLAANVTYPNTAVTAKNGILVKSGLTYGIASVDFVKDTGDIYWNQGTGRRLSANSIVGRNELSQPYTNFTGLVLVNSNANDVAMTVLPDAPIDPATGLPVPTIAVATNGGVSVIKDDGTVVDITYGTYNIASKVDFRDDNSLTFTVGSSATAQGWVHVFHDIPASDVADANGYAKGSSDEHYASLYNAAYFLDLQWPGAFSANTARHLTPLAWGGLENLIKLAPNKADPSKGMLSAITSSYNTGWMNGNIKGAFLSSTDATSLVGSGELAPDLTAYADQAAAVADGWSTVEAGWTFDAANDQWVHDGSANSNIKYDTLPLLDGVDYYLSFDVVNAGQVTAYVGTGSEAGSYALNLSSGSHGLWLKAGTQGDFIQFRRTSGAPSVKNISLYRGDADRSVNNKGLIVNGTVTRSAVATGAELVAYSGFSASNYLEQPYNSALDFGTGDFCVMGWVNVTSGSVTARNQTFFDRYSGTAGMFVRADFSTGVINFSISDGTSTSVKGTQNIGGLGWVHFAAVRSNGVAYVYQNGLLVGSGANARSMNATVPSWVGNAQSATSNYTQGSLALLRISATAPTAEQIKKIYEDEKVLFQENAAATLYGASDAVTALAHDSDTGLLHVGTSAGRSVFQGLRRVANTTTAVGTAISASNSLVVDE